MLATIISRLRRNHGLEHATIHVLTEKHKGFSAQGNSTPQGFHLNIYGDVPETAVMDAVEEAYQRMKKGEHQLAVHPNCGTVLLTTAVLTTLAAQAVFIAEQRRQRSNLTPAVLFNALPTAILAVVATLIVSRPIGVQLQARYTVEGDLGNLQIRSIRKVTPSPIARLFQFMLTGGQLRATSYKIETTG
jgi:energy-converting hydrogenase Eha subunit A